MIAEGLIDTISGDDVPFPARLVERAGRLAAVSKNRIRRFFERAIARAVHRPRP
jgi:hypothetical protein